MKVIYVTGLVTAAECQIIRHIENLVEDLVGPVFDVIGLVTQPFYVVRFNSKQHIEEMGVTVGMKVYYAPKSKLTSYVFLEQLMAMKISHASWSNDEEPPSQFLDHSDDEEEQRVKRKY